MIGFNIEKTCIEAISKLASRSGRRGPHFGFTGRDDGKLEKDFQEALTNELGELTNSKKLNILWKREIRYKTRALTNNDYMTIDIVGVVENELVAAIELKYVTVNYKNA